MQVPEPLARAFADGTLLAPDVGVPGFVDLVRALADRCGCGATAPTGHAERLAAAMGDPRHLLFVLVDGLGENLLARLPPDSFLRSHRRETLRAVFPSTTAAALNTLATGEWPAVHGVLGWYLYLAEHDRVIRSLPFDDRTTGVPAEQLGVDPDSVFACPSLWRGGSRQITMLQPEPHSHSTFTRYFCGGRPATPCADRNDALRRALDTLEALEREPGRGYTYVYLPQLDSLCHQLGIEDPLIDAELADLDRVLASFANALPADTRLIVSADHGHITGPPDQRTELAPDDPLCAHLRAPPAGEPRVPIFHVRPGAEADFEDAFEERLGEHFVWLPADVVEELELLGPAPLTQRARRRLGTGLALSPDRGTLFVRQSDGRSTVLTGVHAGLTPEELEIPLILV